MYTQTPGSTATLRSLSNALSSFFLRVVVSGLMGLLLLGSVGLAQAQSTADSESEVMAERTSVDTLVTFSSLEDVYRWLGETTVPSRPKVKKHEVETRLIEVEGNLEGSIEETLKRLKEATRPSRPTVELHEIENRLIEVEGNLEASINKDLKRLKEATRPPRPTVEQHEVENRLIEVEGDLEKSIEEDLERLETSDRAANDEGAPPGL